jgi:hypothetical protein
VGEGAKRVTIGEAIEPGDYRDAAGGGKAGNYVGVVSDGPGSPGVVGGRRVAVRVRG